VSFVTIYRKRRDRENGVGDVLPGSKFLRAVLFIHAIHVYSQKVDTM